MTRLYDKLLEMPGGETDQIMLGGVTKFVEQLKQAECFQLSQDISFACGDVLRSKPSSLLGSLDMVRVPYERTWVEWSPSEREGNRDNHHLFSNEKPQPKRVGGLIWTDESCARGYLVLAWEHKDGSVMVCPLTVIFNWNSNDTTPVFEQYLRSMFGHGGWVDETIAKRVASTRTLGMPDKWVRFDNDEEERRASTELSLRGEIVPLEIFMPFLSRYKLLPGVEWYESFCDDLAGELPFLEAFFLLLNSRNTIIRQVRDDFTKLNKVRAKNKKTPLKEFITTRLRVSKVMGNRAKASGLSRQQAEMHLVRGHFKVRKSGVYWWSPHPRGAGTLRRRKTYEVHA